MTTLARSIAGQCRVLLGSRLGLSLLGLFVAMSIMTCGVYERLVLRNLQVAVVDLDATHMTRLLTTNLDATPELSVQWVPGGSVEAARTALERGEVVAYILIPSGFTAQLKQGQKARFVVASDMSNILIGKTVRSACSRVVATLNVGVEMTLMRKLGTSRAAATAQAYPIVVEDNQIFNPATNYAEYLIPIVVFFLLHIYATVLFSGSFLEDSRPGLPAPRVWQLATTMVFCVGLAALSWRLLPWAQVTMASPVWLGTVVFLTYAMSQAAFVSAVFCIIPNGRIAFQNILFLSMLGLMLSGVTWPTYEFPAPLATLSEFLPYTHLARMLRMTVHFEAQLSDVLPTIFKLCGLTLGFAVITLVSAQLRARLGRIWTARFSHDASAQ